MKKTLIVTAVLAFATAAVVISSIHREENAVIRSMKKNLLSPAQLTNSSTPSSSGMIGATFTVSEE